MTHPNPLLTAAATSTPVYRFDGLTLSGLGTTDTRGRQWELTDEKGWTAPAALRNDRNAKVSGHGSERATAWRSEHTFTVSGTVHSDDPDLIEQTILELGGLCGDGANTYEVRRTAGSVDHVRNVELNASPEIDKIGPYDVDFLFTFAAPDPRKYDAGWQERRLAVPTSGIGGLDYSGGGLQHTGGLDYGTAPTPVVAQIVNTGKAPTAPVLTLRGALGGGLRLVQRETGRTLTYAMDVAAAETVTINCADQPQRGLDAHECYSSTRGSVRPLVVVGTDWPQIDPGATATFELIGTGAPVDDSSIAARSAWW